VSSLGQVAKESTNRLGPSAALVQVLPSTSLVLVVFALITSRLYPWASPLHDAKGKKVAAGIDSVMHTVKGLNATGGVMLILVVLVTAVMIRPFQVAAVQFLEGYWNSRGLRIMETLAVERHARRLSFHRSRQLVAQPRAGGPQFDAVARADRQTHRIDRMTRRAQAITERYPERVAHLLPTSLGNVLRRAETSAGERYGLNTVVTYRRLYSHLSSRLDQKIAMQLDIIDTMATFTLVFWAEGLAAAPLLFRVDWWSLVPLAFGVFSAITYRGARLAAEHHAHQLSTAYDLHRFDMLRTMHRRLPKNALEEYSDNQELSDFLAGIAPIPESERVRWTYSHPDGGADDAHRSGGLPDAPPGEDGSTPSA
jgi:hypothetical protein